MAFDLWTALAVGLGFAISGFFNSLGQAVNEVYFKPWLKRFKRRHVLLLKKLKR